MNTLITASLIIMVAIIIGILFKVRQWVQAIRRDSSRIEFKLNELSRQTDEAIKRSTQEMVNAACLSSLQFKFPVFFGGWSVDSFLGRLLVQHIFEHKPKCILELGSGSSTILIARTLQLLDIQSTEHLVVDHEKHYLDLTQENARLNSLTDGIKFIHCPLEKYESLDKIWYGGLTDKLVNNKIDLLIIDGPPGPLQPLSRYPALPLLLPYLSEHCTILLDDAIRDDEKEIVKLWLAENAEFTHSLSIEGHGLSILTR